MNLTFIVFTFGSMLVAIQIASAQLSPRIIVTVLLRDNAIRIVVGLFTYGLVISLGARTRTETISDFVISIAALWGLVSVVAFLFLIDHAARLLRPLSIVRRVAEQGLKVFADVYPDAAGLEPDRPRLRTDALPVGRTIAHVVQRDPLLRCPQLPNGPQAAGDAVGSDARITAVSCPDTSARIGPSKWDPGQLFRGPRGSGIGQNCGFPRAWGTHRPQMNCLRCLSCRFGRSPQTRASGLSDAHLITLLRDHPRRRSWMHPSGAAV